MKCSRTSDRALFEHIQSLGLSTVEAYQDWCDRHGFSRRTKKQWRMRLKERAFAMRATAVERLTRKKKEQRSRVALLRLSRLSRVLSPIST